MTAFIASRKLRDWTTALASQPEPSALVTSEPGCYHFRVLDPPRCRDPLRDPRRGNNRPLLSQLSLAAG
jgi:hypothetical protein